MTEIRDQQAVRESKWEIRNWKDPDQRGTWACAPQFIIQNLNFTITHEARIASSPFPCV